MFPFEFSAQILYKSIVCVSSHKCSNGRYYNRYFISKNPGVLKFNILAWDHTARGRSILIFSHSLSQAVPQPSSSCTSQKLRIHSRRHPVTHASEVRWPHHLLLKPSHIGDKGRSHSKLCWMNSHKPGLSGWIETYIHPTQSQPTTSFCELVNISQLSPLPPPTPPWPHLPSSLP